MMRLARIGERYATDRELTVTVGARGNIFRLLVSILGTMHRQALGGAGMFTKPWKQRSARYLAPSDDLLEYVCSENNSGPKHMTGK